MKGKTHQGVFITLEGPDGSGKSTQAKLLADWLVKHGITVTQTREPGGTATGDQIRKIVLDPSARVGTITEVLLMAASRAQHVEEVIVPALEKGNWVVCDRFVDSSIVYQGYALGVTLQDVVEVNRIATRGLSPDLTLVLDVDPLRGLDQVSRRETRRKRDGTQDRIERRGAQFQDLVRAGYRKLLEENPERISWIDVGNRGIKEIHDEVVSIVAGRLLSRRLN